MEGFKHIEAVKMIIPTLDPLPPPPPPRNIKGERVDVDGLIN